MKTYFVKNWQGTAVQQADCRWLVQFFFSTILQPPNHWADTIREKKTAMASFLLMIHWDLLHTEKCSDLLFQIFILGQDNK